MPYTDTKLKIFNVFPTEESYNQNSSKLGSNELSLVPYDESRAIEETKKQVVNDLNSKGEDGQVLAVGQTSVKTKNLVEFYQVVNNPTDLEFCKTNKVGFETIFNNWYRFTHHPTGQNLPAYDKEKNAWTYDKATDTIRSNVNSTTYMGFVNSDKLDVWNMTCKITGNDTDDDYICLLLAFMTDSKGVEHTISVIRNGGIQAKNPAWSIWYDLFLSTRLQLVQKNSILDPLGNWGNGNFAHVYAARNKTQFVCKTSQLNSTTLDEASTLTYNMPTSKPSTMTDEAYNNIRAMMSKPSAMGFGCQSENGIFSLISQNIIKDTLIYDFQSKKILEFKNNAWTVKGSLELPNYSIIFNKVSKKLFYYENDVLTELN